MTAHKEIVHKEPVWIMPTENEALKESIIQEFHLHPVSAQILISRGFTALDDIHRFLYAQLPDLYDPFLMTGMKQAVERILAAIDRGESILIYGDNDVDGMTGTALLTEFLQKIGANVLYYISNRSILRQSLFLDALEYAIQHACKLMITVDCGITAAVEIAQFVERKIDVIITDHHEPTDEIPRCVATLNPKLVNNTYPNRELTGVGVAFKLAHALTNQLSSEGKLEPNAIDLKHYLDLVAMGTVSDMGMLVGENRIMVRYGLQQLERTERIGLVKLMNVSDMESNEIKTYDIASKLAPRLNSLGRIADPKKGVELLLLQNTKDAERMAKELDLNNIERQKIERVVTTDVEKQIESDPSILDKKAIIMWSNKWHPGVIAIVCTRVSRQYNRPTVMMAIDNKIAKASLRSIREFPLLPVLKESSDILLNYGGHDFAAGLTIRESDLGTFKERFIQAADKQLKDEDVQAKIFIDSEVDFSDLTYDFLESIHLLEPFGNENAAPILYCYAKQAWPPKIVGKTHLRMYLEQNDRVLEGVAFNKGSMIGTLRKKNLKLRVAFTPQVNTFQSKSSIQLLIRDFQVVDK